MRTDDFSYDLPDELIAQAPAEPRDTCRLLVLDKRTGAVDHERFGCVPYASQGAQTRQKSDARADPRDLEAPLFPAEGKRPESFPL